MTRVPAATALLAGLLAAGAVTGQTSTQARTSLTGAPGLGRAYDAILDARFDELPARLTQACGPAPPEACALLAVAAQWWQIQIDPHDRSRDPAFASQVDQVIAQAEAWTQREPRRAEAWFYLGAAHGVRVQWRVLRGAQLAAARDGSRIKSALERALALDPALGDAYVGIGLYHYYAAVAPAAARVLRWLLFLPGGDRDGGLQEIQRGREQAVLLRSEAEYQLHVIDLWYEARPERALARVLDLAERHPSNPHFQQIAADIEERYLHDPSSSLRRWLHLLELARAGTVRLAPMAEASARLGAARQLDALFEADAAVAHLEEVVRGRPAQPFGALSQGWVQLGEALDRLGRREDAIAAYRAAVSAVPAGDPLGIAGRARRGLRTRPDPDDAAAYRLSIDALRALERGELIQARQLVTRSLALRPDDPVARYRHSRILRAQGDEAAAQVIVDALLVSREGVPGTVYAAACMDAAAYHEAQGTTEQAAALYRTAISVFGIDRRMKADAERRLARLEAARVAPR